MIGLCIVGVVLFSFAKSIIVIVVVVSKISYRKLRKWVHRKLNYNKWQRINKIKELEIQRKEKETRMLLKAIKENKISKDQTFINSRFVGSHGSSLLKPHTPNTKNQEVEPKIIVKKPMVMVKVQRPRADSNLSQAEVQNHNPSSIGNHSTSLSIPSILASSKRLNLKSRAGLISLRKNTLG